MHTHQYLFIELGGCLRGQADISSGSAELNLTNYVAAVKRYMVSWLRAEWNSTDLPVVAVGDPVQISLELQRKYGFLLQ